MLLIGIDLGTTGVKAVVFDETGHVLAQKYDAYEQEAVHGKRELQAQPLWNSCEKVLAEAMTECPEAEEATICVSSFGEGFVCMDEHENILSPVMLLTDDRGRREFGEVVKEIGANRVAKVCGLKPHQSYSLSKILYLRKSDGENFQKIKHILLMGDFVLHQLGAEYYTDYSMASRTMLFDVYNKKWSKEFLDICELSESLFSKPVLAGSIVGEAAPKICEKLHLPKKTLLVMGGHDQGCSAVTTQGSNPGTICGMGTSECITPILKQPLAIEKILQNAHPNEPFFKEGIYNTLAYNVTSGLLMEWFLKVYAKAERKQKLDVYSLMESEMPEDPTNLMVLPYLHGSGTPYLDPDCRLSIMGMNEVTRRGDVYKALMEGLCMDQLLNIELLGREHLAGDGMVATGGGSKSAPWLQIKADILHMPVHTLECSQSGALGCAILGATAAGIYDSMEQAVDTMVRRKDTFLPEEKNYEFYMEKYQVYKKLYEANKAADQFASAHE